MFSGSENRYIDALRRAISDVATANSNNTIEINKLEERIKNLEKRSK